MEFTDQQEDESLNVGKYIDMALRHIWLIIIPPILLGIFASFYALSVPKVYQASTLILVEGSQIINPLIQGIAVATSAKDKLLAIKEEILSWPRLLQLIEELGLSEEEDDKMHLINSLKRRISVSFRKNGLIVISCEDNIPVNAQKIVEKISEILIRRNLSSSTEEADEAIEFIERQLDEYRTKLEGSEEKLRKFQEAYTVSLPVAAKVNQRLIDLEIELNTLLIDNTESHPAVLSVKKKIEQLKGEKEREMSKIKSTGLDTESPDFEEISYSVPRQQQELAKLQRDTKVNAALYEQLLSRLESAKISKRLEGEAESTKFRIIEPPQLPYSPIKPNIPRIIIFGIVLGLGMGGGITFLIEMSNKSFRSVEEANNVLAKPILGAISTIDLKKKALADLKHQERVEVEKRKRAKEERSGNPILGVLRFVGKLLGLV